MKLWPQFLASVIAIPIIFGIHSYSVQASDSAAIIHDAEYYVVAAQHTDEWAAEDADLYVDKEGGFPVAFRGGYSGAYEPLKFQGVFNVQIALTAINAHTPVELPPSCSDPISM